MISCNRPERVIETLNSIPEDEATVLTPDSASDRPLRGDAAGACCPRKDVHEPG
jgi:hypothetical protein